MNRWIFCNRTYPRVAGLLPPILSQEPSMLWDSYMLIKVIIHTTSFLSPSSLTSFIPLSHFFYFCVVILFKRCCDLFISLLPLIIVILCSLLHPLSLSSTFLFLPPLRRCRWFYYYFVPLWGTKKQWHKRYRATRSMSWCWTGCHGHWRWGQSVVLLWLQPLHYLILSCLICKFIFSVILEIICN